MPRGSAVRRRRICAARSNSRSIWQEYSSRGVKVIGLAVQSGWASDIQKFAKQYNMHYTVLVGNDDTVADFGVISFPRTYVIGPGWKLYRKYSGVSEDKALKIRQDIEALLKEKR